MSSLRKNARIQLMGTYCSETADDFLGLNDYLGDTEFQFGRTACNVLYSGRHYKKMQIWHVFSEVAFFNQYVVCFCISVSNFNLIVLTFVSIIALGLSFRTALASSELANKAACVILYHSL